MKEIKLKYDDIYVRQENERDYESIGNINYVAFARQSEKELVDKIRNSDSYADNLSFVAEINVNLASAILFKKSNNQFELVSDTDRKQIGHIMYSEISLQDDEELHNEGILALAPMSVVQSFQNMKVGTKLIDESIKYIKSRGYKMIIVLGHKDYYSKFGFEKASKHGIYSPFEGTEESFMVLKLTKEADNIKGLVVYPDIFYMI